MATKRVQDMTRAEFEALPWRKNWSEDVVCDSIIVLPANVSLVSLGLYRFRVFLADMSKLFRRPDEWEVDGLHDSGFRCMDFVAVNGDEPICRLAGGSDVLHFDGIGGFGDHWLQKYGTVPRSIPPSGWSMDCLPKSGLLRVWPSVRKMKCGAAFSSFEIYALFDKQEGSEE